MKRHESSIQIGTAIITLAISVYFAWILYDKQDETPIQTQEETSKSEIDEIDEVLRVELGQMYDDMEKSSSFVFLCPVQRWDVLSAPVDVILEAYIKEFDGNEEVFLIVLPQSHEYSPSFYPMTIYTWLARRSRNLSANPGHKWPRAFVPARIVQFDGALDHLLLNFANAFLCLDRSPKWFQQCLNMVPDEVNIPVLVPSDHEYDRNYRFLPVVSESVSQSKCREIELLDQQICDCESLDGCRNIQSVDLRVSMRSAMKFVPRSTPAPEPKGKVVFFHVSLPVWDFKGSDARLLTIFDALLAHSYKVGIVPQIVEHAKEYHRLFLESIGIEVYDGATKSTLDGVDIAVLCLWTTPPYWDWLDRWRALIPSTTQVVILSDESHWFRAQSVSYHNQDLSSEYKPSTITDWRRLLRREADLYESADLVTCITQDDCKKHKIIAPNTPVAMLSHVITNIIATSSLPWDRRKDIIFLGYDNDMNVASLEWFVDQVWPQLFTALGECRLHVVGTVKCPMCDGVAGIVRHGQLQDDDLGMLLGSVRVFVSPMLAGTGLNMKNVMALLNGVPLVTSKIGTKGMILESDDVCRVCDLTSSCFHEAIVNVYNDQNVWEMMAENGQKHVKLKFPIDSLHNEVIAMMESLDRPSLPEPQLVDTECGYFVAAMLHNNEPMMYDFIASLLRLTGSLKNVFVSIYESSSTDNTPILVRALEVVLARRGIDHHVVTKTLDRADYYMNRPKFLARLRNLALKPLTSAYSKVIVLNDVLFNPADVLSLIHTPVDYDMVCAMDFSYASWQIYPDLRIDDKGSPGLRFYDTWVSRDLRGSLMLSRPPYVTEPRSQALMAKGQPVPVYSCWNGIVVFRSDPWLQEGLRFRAAHGDECTSSECHLWCHDMWSAGFNRIFINPQVRVAYDISVFKQAQQLPYEGIAHPPLPLTEHETAFLLEPRVRPSRLVCCANTDGFADADWKNCRWKSSLSTPHMKNVVFEGQIFEEHSYAVVNREFVSRMSRDPSISLTVVVVPGDEQFVVDGRFDDREVMKDVMAMNTLPMDADIYIRNYWPPQWAKPSWFKGHLILMQPWEFGHIPQEWRDHLDDVYKIIVPSRYVRSTYIRSGVSESKIAVVSHGVELNRFAPHVNPYHGIATDSTFKFLFHGGLLPRKGIDVLIKAYVQAFTPFDDVMLVLHTTYVHASDEYVALIERLVNSAIHDGYRIQWLRGTRIPEAQLGGLYTAVDAFVLPYRAEGFGLPIIEAMSSQIPVIVTSGGASDDFVAENEGYLVQSREQPCKIWPCSSDATCLDVFCTDGKCSCGKLVSHAYWLEPSVDDLAEKMRYVTEHPIDRRNKAAAGRLSALRMSWDRVYDVWKREISIE